MAITTAGPPPAGINWQAVIFTEMGLVIDPEIEMDPGLNATFNLGVAPDIYMLGPVNSGLQVSPGLTMSPSTIGEGAFNVAVDPTIGVNMVPDTAFNVNIESSVTMHMGSVSTRESAAAPLSLSPSFSMSGTYVAGPPAFDNSAVSAYQNGITSGTPFTWSQTCAANPYAIVALFLDGGTSH